MSRARWRQYRGKTRVGGERYFSLVSISQQENLRRVRRVFSCVCFLLWIHTYLIAREREQASERKKRSNQICNMWPAWWSMKFNRSSKKYIRCLLPRQCEEKRMNVRERHRQREPDSILPCWCRIFINADKFCLTAKHKLATKATFFFFLFFQKPPHRSLTAHSLISHCLLLPRSSNFDLREAYARGLISAHDHRILHRAKNQQLTLADALKMGVLKVGDAQSYNVISKTESLVISSVFDHRANTYIDPNSAIQKKILDPYHGSYVNNLTQEKISIDDAMNKNLIIVEQQSSIPHSSQANEKYVISTSLIRETRSYHLLGVRDYVNNRELSVQEAIRLGILDKQNGQYINRKTNETFSISEAIAQGHIRAQALPVDGSTTSTTTTSNTHETIGNPNVKRGTVKETKTYTLKSAIHPKTRKEIPIRQGKDSCRWIKVSIFCLSLQQSMKASLITPKAFMLMH